MIDFIYNGNKYKLVKNRALFQAVNVLFMGLLFIENKRYKKYINCAGVVYLVED
jgi:hypothetical protein